MIKPNKLLWKVLLGALTIVMGAVLLMIWWGISKQGVPGPDALKALETIDSNAAVEVEFGDWFVIRPTAMEPTAGLIIYPGAHSDVRGYVKVMTRIAEAGYLVVATKMPLGYAFLAPDRAEDVFAAYPNIEHWFLAGHSLGGAMAGQYAAEQGEKLAGLIFWDSYPPESSNLVDSELPTLLIHRATPQGEKPQIYQDKKNLFPESTEWVAVPGGNHGQFGDSVGGMYKELGSFVGGEGASEWQATISRDEQQAIIVAAMLDWFGKVLNDELKD
ncbi:MAG: alpha/beta hydrolase [Gammaproteobacteria bacterium]